MLNEVIQMLLPVGKFILASAVLLGFYRLFYSKNLTYTESRVFLLCTTLFALAVSQLHVLVPNPQTKIVWIEAEQQPHFSINRFFNVDPFTNPTQLDATIASAAVKVDDSTTVRKSDPTLMQRIWVLYLFVLFALALNLSLQYLKINNLKKRGKVEQRKGYQLVMHSKVSTPFSFQKTIFLPVNLNKNQMEIVESHERWHIQHKHYKDVFIQEFLSCVFWFNPIQWIIRKDLRSIHEFQADRSVLNEGCDLYRYQTIILEEVMGNHFRLANGFNQSFTKKRFIQMKKQEPSKSSPFRKLMLVPILALLFGTFCVEQGQSQVIKVVKKTTTADASGKPIESTVTYESPIEQKLDQKGAAKFLDSISRLTDQVVPILKKLEKETTYTKGNKNLDELLHAMNMKMNENVLSSNDFSPEFLASLTSSDFKELETYLTNAQSIAKKRQASSNTNTTDEQVQALMQEFTNLKLFKKILPEMVQMLGSMMTTMMNGLSQVNGNAPLNMLTALMQPKAEDNVTISEPVPVYVNPYCKLDENLFDWSDEPFGVEHLVSIARNTTETVVTLAIPVHYNEWFKFNSNFYILDKQNGDKYLIRSVLNMPLNTEIFIHEVNKKMILAKLYFPALKSKVKKIDLVENDGKGWFFQNIDVSKLKRGEMKFNNIIR